MPPADSNHSPLLDLAEMGLRRARSKMRGKMRGQIGDEAAGQPATSSPDDHSKAGPGRTIGQAALLYGVSRLATRSLPGALLVGGGFLVKNLLAKSRSGDAEDADINSPQ